MEFSAREFAEYKCVRTRVGPDETYGIRNACKATFMQLAGLPKNHCCCHSRSINQSGAMENYTLTGNTDNIILQVDVDVTDDRCDYFKDTFPKALDKV